MSDECKLQKIINKSIGEICQMSKYCAYDYVNLNELHFCYFQGKFYLSLPILIFFGCICFYLMSDTANKYLSQGLTNISDKLNLSQNLAGVTLLAIGNGANDVVSSIIASHGEDSEGLDVAIAALLGGGLFVSCLVFSFVVLFAKTVKVFLNFVYYIMLLLIEIY